VASTASGSVNFRLYWDGMPQDALLDGSKFDKYNDSGKSFSRLVTYYNLGPGSTCNGSKNTPNLSADILGDWREEVILYSVGDDETYLGVYSTNYENFYPVPTLMHDHTYRMAVCWQNTAYNQPPHLGYNLALEMAPRLADDSREFTVPLGEEMQIAVNLKHVKSASIAASYLPDGTRKVSMLPTGFKRTNDYKAQTITITGTPDQEGQYVVALKLTDLAGSTVKSADTLRINVVNTTGITVPRQPVSPAVTDVYDLSGKRLPYSSLVDAPRGLYILEERTAEGIVRRKVVR
jgi:rhamnogalacturonan endolyase